MVREMFRSATRFSPPGPRSNVLTFCVGGSFFESRVGIQVAMGAVLNVYETARGGGKDLT